MVLHIMNLSDNSARVSKPLESTVIESLVCACFAQVYLPLLIHLPCSTGRTDAERQAAFQPKHTLTIYVFQIRHYPVS